MLCYKNFQKTFKAHEKKNSPYTSEHSLMVAPEGPESARDNFGKYIHQFQPVKHAYIYIYINIVARYTYISTYLYLYRGCPRGVMVKAMNCRIVVSEFELQSRYYVHFRANSPGKGQSSHKMYSNNILNFQASTTILNACTKKVWCLIECAMYIYIYIYIHIYIYSYTAVVHLSMFY